MRLVALKGYSTYLRLVRSSLMYFICPSSLKSSTASDSSLAKFTGGRDSGFLGSTAAVSISLADGCIDGDASPSARIGDLKVQNSDASSSIVQSMTLLKLV